MRVILCPTRGGEPSYPNQDKAIAIAKERKAKLIFLYISNVQFLNRTASPVVVDVAKELEDMGEFLLAMAQERAERAGYQAEALVRRGEFRQVLVDVIAEQEVDTLVMGSSDRQTGTGITTPEYLEKLSEEFCEEMGVEVIMLYQGEIVGTSKPEA